MSTWAVLGTSSPLFPSGLRTHQMHSNGEFEMTTQSANNSFVEDGKLYILPTLTSDIIGFDNVIDGYTYNITGCTNTNCKCPYSSIVVDR